MVKKNWEDNILTNRFREAQNELRDYSWEEIKNMILKASFKNPNRAYYDFVKYSIEQNPKDCKLYEFASELLSSSLNFLPDAYKKAYRYAKKVTECNPNNVEDLEWLLFFYETPEKCYSKKVLKNIICDILSIDRTNEKANNLIKTEFNSSYRDLCDGSYKTYKGKTYTQEEWEAYEQQQWIKHNTNKE